MATLLNHWRHVRQMPGEENIRQFRERLHLIVGRDYRWLASELFEIEGELGWGPGVREWGGDGYPPATAASAAMMETFLRTLESSQKDDTLILSLWDASRGRVTDTFSRMLTKYLKVRDVNRHAVIQHFYARVATTRSVYTLGAARIYLLLWLRQRRFKLALAGLLHLLLHPLNKLVVRAETVRRRKHSAFRRGDLVSQRAQPVVLAVQQAVCYS